MINPTELQIEQLDGSIEKFYIAHANEFLQISGAEYTPEQHEYRVYKSNPIMAFSLVVQEKANGLFVRHVEHNFPDYEGKNIVFEALRFIVDQHKTPVFSSLKVGFYTDDESDRLMPGTMGARWAKMLKRYPERVKLLADGSRYVFLPDQV